MQWNHMKSFKFTIFYDLETKIKALVIIQWKFLEIGQFLSEQRAFEKKKLFLGHCVCKTMRFIYCSEKIGLNLNPFVLLWLSGRLSLDISPLIWPWISRQWRLSQLYTLHICYAIYPWRGSNLRPSKRDPSARAHCPFKLYYPCYAGCPLNFGNEICGRWVVLIRPMWSSATLQY